MDNQNQVGYPRGYYVEGEDEQHHEKKSVLKKVKAKAKKIKDTITKHGHGHNHDHDHGHEYPEGHIPDDHDLDEEDDEDDEEIVEDPEVHGAPIYDSTAIKSGVSGQPEDFSRPGITQERLKATPLDPIAPRENVETFNSGNYYKTQGNDPTKSSVPGLEPLVTEQPRVNFGKTTDITEAPKAPQNTPAASFHGAPIYESAAVKSGVSGQPEDLSRPGVTSERLKATPLDPISPRESVETFNSGNKKTQGNYDHPTKSSVPGMVEPLVAEQPRVNFRKTTDIIEAPKAPQHTPVVPSLHHTEDPAKTFDHGQEGYHTGQPKVNLQRPKGLEKDPAAPKDISEPYSTTNYQTKVTDPTGKGGEAIGITPILRSLDKMNIHDEQDKGRERNLPSGTHHRTSDLTFPTGSHDQFSPEPTPPEPLKNTPLVSETRDTAKDEEYSLNLASEKPSSQSSYTEKISSTTSAIADKAVSAKNIVASKLGYGEKDQTPANEYHEGQEATKQASVADYGKKMAATVTETLTPVYEKVAEAGSTVMSKLHGPGGTGTASEVAGTGTDVPEQDKGVTMKGYVVEKLRPGEEDRALAEAISDVLHKQEDDVPGIETRSRGKLTESEETVRVVHTGDERDGNSPTNGGVVDKIKGAVGSWFGKGEGSQGTPQPQAHDSSYGNEDFASFEGEPRLQESAN